MSSEYANQNAFLLTANHSLGTHITDFANKAIQCVNLPPDQKLINAQNYAFLGAVCSPAWSSPLWDFLLQLTQLLPTGSLFPSQRLHLPKSRTRFPHQGHWRYRWRDLRTASTAKLQLRWEWMQSGLAWLLWQRYLCMQLWWKRMQSGLAGLLCQWFVLITGRTDNFIYPLFYLRGETLADDEMRKPRIKVGIRYREWEQWQLNGIFLIQSKDENRWTGHSISAWSK